MHTAVYRAMLKGCGVLAEHVLAQGIFHEGKFGVEISMQGEVVLAGGIDRQSQKVMLLIVQVVLKFRLVAERFPVIV